MKKILGRIFIGILLVIILLNLVIIVQTIAHPDKIPGLFGYKPFIVLSGSMQTQIAVGDLVVVKEVDPAKLKVNDIIAFRSSDDYVTTHRIINIVDVNGVKAFETKGDSNNIKDNDLVYPEKVEGIYKFRIAKLGKFILFIQEPSGFLVCMIAVLFVGIFIFMIENNNQTRKLREENEKLRNTQSGDTSKK